MSDHILWFAIVHTEEKTQNKELKQVNVAKCLNGTARSPIRCVFGVYLTQNVSYRTRPPISWFGRKRANAHRLPVGALARPIYGVGCSCFFPLISLRFFCFFKKCMGFRKSFELKNLFINFKNCSWIWKLFPGFEKKNHEFEIVSVFNIFLWI